MNSSLTVANLCLNCRKSGSVMMIHAWIDENCERFIEFVVNCCFWRFRVSNWGWIYGFLCVFDRNCQERESVILFLWFWWVVAISLGLWWLGLYIADTCTCKPVRCWHLDWTEMARPWTNSGLGTFLQFLKIQGPNCKLKKD